VTVPETGTCGDKATPIATIGVYKSSYDPACAEGTQAFEDTYSLIAPIESKPTLEFPLLFPSQTGYGGALGETGEFTTCDAAWAPLTGTLETASLNTAVSSVFTGIDAQIKPSKDSTLASIRLVPTVLDQLVAGLWSDAVKEQILPQIEALYSASLGVTQVAAGITQQVCNNTAEQAAIVGTLDYSSQQECGGESMHDLLIDTFSGSNGYGGDCTTVCSVDAAQCQQCQVVEQYALLQSEAPNSTNPYTGLAGISITENDMEKQNWSGFKLILKDLAQGGDALASALASAGLTLLNICDGSSLAECNANTAKVYSLQAADGSTSSTTDDSLCLLIGLDFAAGDPMFPNGTAAATALGDPNLTCNFDTATGVLKADLAVLLAGLDLSELPLPETVNVAALGAALVDFLDECPTTVSVCLAGLEAQIEVDFEGLPDDLSRDDWLPATFSGAGNAYELVAGLAQADPTSLELAAANGVLATCQANAINENCETLAGSALTATVGATLTTLAALPGAPVTDTQCLTSNVTELANLLSNFGPAAPLLIQGCQLYGLRTSLINAASESLLEGTSAQERLDSCTDDEKDIEVFETAQMMVPAAIGAVGAGALVSFIAVATKKMPVALVGGILSVIGGGILMGALLYIQSEAPVYKNLEASAEAGEVAGELFYQGGMAQLLALAAVGASILGGLVTVGSAFCAGAEDETAISAKVDGTY